MISYRERTAKARDLGSCIGGGRNGPIPALGLCRTKWDQHGYRILLDLLASSRSLLRACRGYFSAPHTVGNRGHRRRRSILGWIAP
jgi:hypothetical protein